MNRPADVLAMTDDEEQAEAAATWDQVEAILDGFPVTAPRPGAKRVADVVAEVERLRGHRESCTENLLKGYETGKAEERAAVVAFLRARSMSMGKDHRAITGDSVCWAEIELVGAAVNIERGEHRREEAT
jgi:hypothetical protein